ncbi:MAG TPA: hypothetical protein VNX70_04550 [Bryobacteraceae bacterium]|nr:hypothetical protein [Bryobacteraceae bacterium]
MLLVIGAIQAWDILDKRGATVAVVAWALVIVAGAYLCFVTTWWSGRFDRLHASLTTVKDASKTSEDGLRKQLSAKDANYAQEMATVRDQFARDLREHRRTVIHAATWGADGLRHMYSRDITTNLNFLLDRHERQNHDVAANDEFLGDGGYPEMKEKLLWVKFSCPCSAIPVEHTFKYGEVIDLKPFCKHA